MLPSSATLMLTTPRRRRCRRSAGEGRRASCPCRPHDVRDNVPQVAANKAERIALAVQAEAERDLDRLPRRRAGQELRRRRLAGRRWPGRYRGARQHARLPLLPTTWRGRKQDSIRDPIRGSGRRRSATSVDTVSLLTIWAVGARCESSGRRAQRGSIGPECAAMTRMSRQTQTRHQPPPTANALTLRPWPCATLPRHTRSPAATSGQFAPLERRECRSCAREARANDASGWCFP